MSNRKEVTEQKTKEKRYLIEGGYKLEGVVEVDAAKNAISKQIVASILTEAPCTFTNVPRITEINAILDMLSEIGASYEWLDEGTLVIQTPKLARATVSEKYSGFNRIPILLLAPLLHRAKEVKVPVVGGCRIGERPVDYHIAGLEAMGASVEMSDKYYIARSGKLQGAVVELPYPSVGATENILMAATLAEGTTVIINAAIEPEIIDTILFLQKMGALIAIDVDRRIIIEGVNELHGATHYTMSDRIEVASLATAALATNGRVTVKNAQQVHMIAFLNELRKAGGEMQVDVDGITFFRKNRELHGTHIETDVHPGFMTDWQQPFVVLLTQAHGVSVIHETVYEDRFGYTHMLGAMGADIDLSRSCLGHKFCRFRDKNYLHSCIVRGPTQLKGQTITIPDLRAGYAYIIAALVAEGASEVRGINYIDRGYAKVPEKLKAIGATIDVL